MDSGNTSDTAKRVAAFRMRAAAAGLRRRDVYLHDDDAPRVLAWVARLAERRKRQAAKQSKEQARIAARARMTTAQQGA